MNMTTVHIKQWQTTIGVTADGDFGPATLAASRALMPKTKPPIVLGGAGKLPWMEIARQQLGLHEGRDNTALRSFLSSDGATLGDPAKLPWCGDFVQTCFKIGLKGEPIPELPYWARSWLNFGDPVFPRFGAVIVFERGPKSGHVAFLVGQDRQFWYCLGGNQNDGVTIAEIDRSRLLGCRWPVIWPKNRLPDILPEMVPGQMTLSTNEA